MKSLTDDFVESISPYGTDLVIQLYKVSGNASRGGDKKWVESSYISSEVINFELRGDEWPVEVFMIEAHYKKLPIDLEEILIINLNAHCKDCLACWYMFEGAFDVSNLDSEWSSKNIYGFCSLNDPTSLALTVSERNSDEWQSRVKSMALEIYKRFPKLRSVR